METDNCNIVLEGHTETVTCVKILPDGRIISGSRDRTIKIWNTKTGICENTFNVGSPVKCINVLPDGRIMTGSYNTLKIWN